MRRVRGHIIGEVTPSPRSGHTIGKVHRDPYGDTPNSRFSCGDTPYAPGDTPSNNPGVLCAALGDTTSERSTGIPMATHRTLVSSPVPMLPKGQTIDPRKPRGHTIGMVPSGWSRGHSVRSTQGTLRKLSLNSDIVSHAVDSLEAR